MLQADLTHTADVALAMNQQQALFDRKVFPHPEFSDRNNLTGDLLGKAGLDQLHRLEAFQWLNQQLAVHLDAFSRELLGPNHALEIHIQKAWQVVCARQGGTIEPHTHRNAQLSAVFYVRTEPDNPSGELEFQAADDCFSHVMAIPYQDAAVSGGVFAPQQHRLLLFPSDLCHQVTPYEGASPRCSVSYDLAITTAPGQGRKCVCPTRWTGSPSASQGRPERIPPVLGFS